MRTYLRKAKTERTATIIIRVSPEMKKKWQAYLKSSHRGVSNLVRHAVSDWIGRNPDPKSLPWDIY